ncbi:hypothetical protein VTJ49DRAFT_7023 [Mycothermus thermophilus]|uniref:F-box domain-containing protein n=1 Tax=Humicola insolens TaxID=85995 RepID=A0ABR3VIF7_HUMIN
MENASKNTNRNGLSPSTPKSAISIRRCPQHVKDAGDNSSEFSDDGSPLLHKSRQVSKVQPTPEQPQDPQHLVALEMASVGNSSPWTPEFASTPKHPSMPQRQAASQGISISNIPMIQIQRSRRNLLLALPPNTWQMILGLVSQDGEDLASLDRLSRTCRALADIVRPVLYRTIIDNVEVKHHEAIYAARKKARHMRHGEICGVRTTADGHGIITKYSMRLYQALHKNILLASTVDAMSLRPAYRHDQPWDMEQEAGHHWWMSYLHYLDRRFQLDLFVPGSGRQTPGEPAIMLSIALLAPNLTRLDLTADSTWGPTEYLLRRAPMALSTGPLSVDLSQVGPLLYMVPNVEELVMVSPKGEWDEKCRPKLLKLHTLSLIHSFVTYKGLIMLVQTCPNLVAFSARNNAIKLPWDDPTCPADSILRALRSIPGKLKNLSIVPYQPQRDFRPPILPHPTRQAITSIPRFTDLRSLSLDCRLLNYPQHSEIGALSQTLHQVHSLQELHLHYPWEITDTAFAGFVIHATKPCPYQGPHRGRRVGWWPFLRLVEAVIGVEEFSPGYVFGTGMGMVTRMMTPGQGVLEAANAAAGKEHEIVDSPFVAGSEFAQEKKERWEPLGRVLRMPRCPLHYLSTILTNPATSPTVTATSEIYAEETYLNYEASTTFGTEAKSYQNLVSANSPEGTKRPSR